MQDPASELPRIPIPRTSVHNERLGFNIQILTTPQLIFRSLLTKGGIQRLEVART
jgi:hypothetical protein